MSTKHTPGPWRLEPCKESVERGDPHGPGFVCYVPRTDAGKVNLGLESNARLIAAAPDLLEALEDCADWLCAAPEGTDQWERGQRARAALNKASGK